MRMYSEWWKVVLTTTSFRNPRHFLLRSPIAGVSANFSTFKTYGGIAIALRWCCDKHYKIAAKIATVMRVMSEGGDL